MATPSSESRTHFERLSTRQTGIDFVSPLAADHPQRYLYHSGFFCGGVAIGDIDGDRLPDIYVVSGPGKNCLYRQVSDFVFEDVTQRSQTDGGDAWGTGASLVDIDNDGDLDIYVCNYDASNLLYINDGVGVFTESSRAFGLNIVDASLQPAFCDYDVDGDLDLYLLTYRYYHPTGAPRSSPVRKIGARYEVLPEYQKYFGVVELGNGKQTLRPIGRPDRLLRNDGGRFNDVTNVAGMAGTGFGLSATWWDCNRDGLMDLYVGNDLRDADHLYRNDGNGRFTDVLADVVPHSTWFSMGADVGDINNDGLLDFLIADMSARTHFKQKTTMGAMGSSQAEMERKRPHQYMRNALYVATRTGRFLEAAQLAGLADSDWTWAVKMADLDNDGRVDVFFTNGMTRSFNDSDLKAPAQSLLKSTEWEVYADTPPRPEQNLAFHNQGNLEFSDASRSWGLDHVGISGPAAQADFDRDGDLDLIVVNVGEPVSVYRNQSSEGHRILLRLAGTTSNRFGVGATVEIRTSAGKQIRQLMPMTGYLSSNEPVVHFGLGDVETIDELTVTWPSGHVQAFENLNVDQFYTIEEPSGSPSPRSKHADSEPGMFRPSNNLGRASHAETPYDDFLRQPLLPNRLSQLGPGIACGDIDGDGDDDLYLGGARGHTGLLYRNDDGQFTQVHDGPWVDDLMCEDMGAIFFDADGDGDVDLFVVSGSVECEPGDESLRDRLYVNDGNGRFTKAPPDDVTDTRDSGSVVCAADFDRDGDLDLFVGGRVIPGAYPRPPQSRLWQNQRGKFTDVTDTHAPGLRTTGLVTGAVWSDADGDGALDLVVTHEWGPVKVYRNIAGQLVETTREAGLARLSGWWNGIAARDLDGDGDIDYVVTNFGLNTKYHASPAQPALLYYGDFDGSGQSRLVEAEFEDETQYPIRGKSCSTRAMPLLGDKFQTYRAFASASLENLYTPECLNEAQRFAAVTLSSGVLHNQGGGQFAFRPLSRLAQISPSFGLALTEVNGDGHPDLYMVQNFFSPQWETGRMDGGLSLLMTGNGDGTFTSVGPDASGLGVPGDAKCLSVCDFSGDGWPDFVVGVNDAPWLTFTHRGASTKQPLKIRLQGKRGNPTGVGARVNVHLTSGMNQTAEVQAGSGYLSQSTATLYFGRGDRGNRVDRIEVLWPGPDRRRSTVRPPADATDVLIEHPQ